MNTLSTSDSKLCKDNSTDLESSKVFSLKGDDDDIQIDQLQLSKSKLEIESNKRFQLWLNSHRSIKIANLSEFSFCGTDHKLLFQESEIKEYKNDEDRFNHFQKISIIPKERKSNSNNDIVKITLTKATQSLSKKSKNYKNSLPEIKENENENERNFQSEGNILLNSTIKKELNKTINDTNIINISEKEIENLMKSNEKDKTKEIEATFEIIDNTINDKNILNKIIMN